MSSYRELYAQLTRDPLRLEQQIRAAVTMAQHDILGDIMRQSQIFMEWSYLHILAESDAKRAKVYWQEHVTAQCREQAEIVLPNEGRKATRDSIAERAAQMPEYKRAQTAYFEAEELASVLKAVVDSLKQKKDMIQSINSRQKVELGDYKSDWIPPTPQQKAEEEERRHVVQGGMACPHNNGPDCYECFNTEFEDRKARYRAIRAAKVKK